MSGGELDGIFGGAASVAKEEPKTKRVKLCLYDRVPAQFLEKVSIKETSNKDLWSVVIAGTKTAQFLHELGATSATGGDARVGIGMSRFAEALLKAIERLRDANVKKILKEEVLAMAIAEAEAIEPSLKILNAGKSSGPGGGTTMASLKRKSTSSAPPQHSEDDVFKAAKATASFLKKPTSALLGLLSLLGFDGDFYVGYCHLKTARAWMEVGGGTEEKAVAAAQARSNAPSAAEEEAKDDAAGLFG
jgi:hypothetical protein